MEDAAVEQVPKLEARVQALELTAVGEELLFLSAVEGGGEIVHKEGDLDAAFLGLDELL